MPEKNCAQKVLDWRSSSIVASSEYEEEDIISVTQTVNKRKAFHLVIYYFQQFNLV